MGWPVDWNRRVAGSACRLCAEGRPDESDAGLRIHFHPLKINYQTLGNRVPHLHTHVTPRYRDDPAPGAPLPDGPNVPRPEREWRADAEALRLRLGFDHAPSPRLR